MLLMIESRKLEAQYQQSTENENSDFTKQIPKRSTPMAMVDGGNLDTGHTQGPSRATQRVLR